MVMFMRLQTKITFHYCNFLDFLHKIFALFGYLYMYLVLELEMG